MVITSAVRRKLSTPAINVVLGSVLGETIVFMLTYGVIAQWVHLDRFFSKYYILLFIGIALSMFVHIRVSNLIGFQRESMSDPNISPLEAALARDDGLKLDRGSLSGFILDQQLFLQAALVAISNYGYTVVLLWGLFTANIMEIHALAVGTIDLSSSPFGAILLMGVGFYLGSAVSRLTLVRVGSTARNHTWVRLGAALLRLEGYAGVLMFVPAFLTFVFGVSLWWKGV